MTYFELEGKVALITGASSGIGAHFAKTLAKQGCIVAIAARRVERLAALAEEIANDGGRAILAPMDVTQRDGIEKALDDIEAQVGPVEILVNNAGMAGRFPFLTAPEDETDQVVAVNLTAVWDVAQLVSQRLVAAKKSGSIINISSITGLRAVGGAASYAMTKAAVAHMTRLQALELSRYGIRVNAIAPGYFMTELTEDFLSTSAGEALRNRVPMKRIGNLEELDGLLLLLSSDRSSFMTGTVVPVDGGHLLSSL
ncbi:SDR family oxidoreductase [Roseovarius pacificus]|uniref:SDR family NAD(P)-dependent oxidoreductase n=1 Tax=Roseovarius pacificus TaxID=337701 RepID=UPI002A18E637|nr:SDR family oxidoreductase [Roseovarius pacificus]